MTVRYIGESFGVDGLTDGKIYECLAVEGSYLRIIDDSGEDYLYSIDRPSDMSTNDRQGEWLLVSDTENRTLSKALFKYRGQLPAARVV